MLYSFQEFSTGALFNISDTDKLKLYKQSRQVDLYTFIWAKSEPIELIIDSLPIILKPNQINPLHSFFV